MEETLGKKRRKTCGLDNLAKDTPDIPGTQENEAARDEEADAIGYAGFRCMFREIVRGTTPPRDHTDLILDTCTLVKKLKTDHAAAVDQKFNVSYKDMCHPCAITTVQVSAYLMGQCLCGVVDKESLSCDDDLQPMYASMCHAEQLVKGACVDDRKSTWIYDGGGWRILD